MSTSKKNQPYNSQLKGVAAFLGEEVYLSEAETTKNTTNSLAIDKIKLPASQPRRYFDQQKLEELARSIKEFGILEPLLVRPLAGGDYELVAGERRLRASQLAELAEVPVVIRDMDDLVTHQVRLIENLQREDLNPLEETEGILELLSIKLQQSTNDVVSLLHRMQNEAKGKVTLNVLGSEEHHITENLFNALGTISWESFVNSRLPLLKLPEDILEVLRQGRIEYTKARAIGVIKDEEQRTQVLEEAIKNNLSLSQIKELIKQSQSSEAVEIPPDKAASQRYDSLGKRLKETKAWSNPKKRKKLEKLLGDIERLLEDDMI